MVMTTLAVILIPFLGTAFGACAVFLVKRRFADLLDKTLSGFTAGIMTAASVWSLLIPSVESAQGRCLPSIAGFSLGTVAMVLAAKLLPSFESDILKNKNASTVIAVTVHNLPEGMAAGASLAAVLSGKAEITEAAVVALAVGIAIQNFPEGAIISMPLAKEGMGKGKACFWGVLSGAVEPIGCIVTLLVAEKMLVLLPYALSFAAGAMMFVVANDLLGQSVPEKDETFRTLSYAAGFAAMMALDVVLG